MKTTASFEDNGAYLTVTVKGEVTNTDDLLELSAGINSEYQKFGHSKIVVDLSKLALPHSLYTYFALVDNYSTVLSPELESANVALAVAEEYSAIAEFYELACANRGYNYVVFLSVDKAVEWIRDMP